MNKHYYNSITKLIILLLVIVTIRMNGQAPGTMDFGTSIVILANGTNPSADQSQSTLLNNFDVSATSNGDITLALANSGNGAGTNAIGGASDAVLGWFGNGLNAVSSGTLSTDNGSEISVTELVFAYEQATGSSVVDFKLTGKRDGAIVGTLDLISPPHNTAIAIDLILPTTGSFLNIDELVITPNSPILGGFSIDDKVIGSAISCTEPDVPTITATSSSVCQGNQTTLNISGNLNDATQWVIYTGSCGGSQIGTTASSSLVVTPSSPSTTYYVRGEDGAGCVDESSGSCGSITVNVTADDNASFSYATAAHCIDASDPTPTITGLAGGTFSSTAGLSINASTGQIDLSASTPGTYTVTYDTTGVGTCPNSSNTSVTINALDDTSFSYATAAHCIDASDPTPTITGLTGGTFSSTAGLSINASTGQIDVSASTPGTYTITYDTTGVGTCPNSSNTSVTINALDDASFSYATAAYCIAASDPTPTITGLAGGTFSSTAGLSINASTGQIDVSASTPGTYTVTYDTTGAGNCPNSSNVSVTINALDDASFSYAASTYDINDADPTPTITGTTGGTFSSTAGLSINTSTGLIDLSASTPGIYTIIYNTTGVGTCPNTSNINIEIINDTPPSITDVAVPNNGIYTIGQNLDFNITFDQNVNVITTGGTPQLSINIGGTTRQAVYVIGTGNSIIGFRYMVQAGDNDADGITIGTLYANGGSIENVITINANLTLNNVGDTSNVLVDTDAPTVEITSSESSPTDNANISVVVNFSENVTGFDLTDLTISNGTATDLTGSGTSYSFTLNPAAAGTVTVDINAGIVTDIATNENMAATQFSIDYDPQLNIADELLSQGLRLYPNPNSGKLYVSADISLSVETIEVLDITGKRIFTQNLDNFNPVNEVQLSGLNAGVYMIKIASDTATALKKLIIE